MTNEKINRYLQISERLQQMEMDLGFQELEGRKLMSHHSVSLEDDYNILLREREKIKKESN